MRGGHAQFHALIFTVSIRDLGRLQGLLGVCRWSGCLGGVGQARTMFLRYFLASRLYPAVSEFTDAAVYLHDVRCSWP